MKVVLRLAPGTEVGSIPRQFADACSISPDTTRNMSIWIADHDSETPLRLFEDGTTVRAVAVSLSSRRWTADLVAQPDAPSPGLSSGGEGHKAKKAWVSMNELITEEVPDWMLNCLPKSAGGTPQHDFSNCAAYKDSPSGDSRRQSDAQAIIYQLTRLDQHGCEVPF